MIVLTVNSGSTSVKLAAYRTPDPGQPGAAATPERLRVEHLDTAGLDPAATLGGFLARLPQPVQAVAHRVVHGGTRFDAPARLEEETLAALAGLSELAPLHNPVALTWIEAARQVLGRQVVQLAVFDTAFFARLPRVAAEYALPPHLTAMGVRRYGFQGLAHEAMWRRFCQLRPELPQGGRLITMQLGGGCSIAALANGRPLDTSMGLTPLEGLVMATRSGSLDPAAVPFLERRLKMTGDEVIELLNRESGLKGLTASDSNPGELLQQQDAQSQFAVDLYCYRVRQHVGAYLAVLGGCDGLVFGGGVGEHVAGVRERILAGMQWAGIDLDDAANRAAQGQEARIDSGRGAVSVFVIPVDEELVMVQAAAALLDAA